MAQNGRIPESDLEVTYLYYPGTTNGRKLLDAVAPYAEAMALAFYLKFGKPLYATDGYRDYDTQVILYNRWRAYLNGTGPAAAPAAEPGTSNHGKGQALDLASNINRFGTAEHQWMRENAGRFGFIHPHWARQGGGREEAWHWEFVGGGTSTPRILRPRTGRGEVGLGSTGDRVERVQGLLNDRLAGPDIVVDGKYGLGTAVATAKFQASKGLTVTGRVGTATLVALENKPVPAGADDEEKAAMTTEEKIDKILWNVRETKEQVDTLVSLLVPTIKDGNGAAPLPDILERTLDVSRRTLSTCQAIDAKVTPPA